VGVAEEDGQVLVVGSGEGGSKEFGRMLREARLASGRSAQEIADGVGVSASFVRAVERGERAPSAESGRKLLEVVGIPAEEGDKGSPFDLVVRASPAGPKVFVSFKAARQGDNSKWSLARLTDPEATPSGSRMHNTLSSWFSPRLSPAPAGTFGIFMPTPGDGTNTEFGRLVRRLAAADRQTLIAVQRFMDTRDREALERPAIDAEPSD
jgi:transcriptional regulator with XRE-family HTH domain